MRVFFICQFAVLTFLLHSQNENKMWYFGPNGAGLDFRNCTVQVVTNGHSNSYAGEGVASVCDENTGRLLFYMVGHVIDSTMNFMPNTQGVGNSLSLTQNLIIKKPGSSHLFYVISPDCQAGAGSGFRGIRYSVVDMTLNNGLGDISQKGIHIKDSANCEKITAVKKPNGIDYWMIAHEYRNNNFLVYEITSAGINLTPTVIPVGPNINSSWSHFNAIGEMRLSPAGDRLGFTCFGDGTTCIFDFDINAGTITNPIQLYLPQSMGGYGLSFSPDGSKLYVGCADVAQWNTPANSPLVQFDLSSNNATTIQNSRTTLYTCASCSFRSLKLGPDGKIYVTKSASTQSVDAKFLSVISKPDSSGLACGYLHNSIDLKGKLCSWGLSNPIEYPIVPIVTPTLNVSASQTLICKGNTTTLSVGGNATGYIWLPGTSTLSSINIVPTSSQIYSVTGTLGNCTATGTIAIQVSECTSVEIQEKCQPLISSLEFGSSINISYCSDAICRIRSTAGSVEKEIVLDATNNRSVRVNDLGKGVYFLTIQSSHQSVKTVTRKFVIY